MLFVFASLGLALASILHAAPDLNGLVKSQEAAQRVLTNFYKSKNPNKNPPGKFYRSTFSIQKAMAYEYASVDPTARKKSFDQRIKDRKKFMKAAAGGGSLNFARESIAKGLYAHIKKAAFYDGVGYGDIDIGASAFLQECEKELEDAGQVGEMDYILAVTGKTTLVFAIDNTGSMSGYIRGAAAIAKQIVNQKRENEVDYILSTINDPTQRAEVKNMTAQQKNEFVSSIDNLGASGGGDCPEEALKGILYAIEKEPQPASPIFVFTDASAKDATEERMTKLKGEIGGAEYSITFFTNKNGCGSGIDTYNELAEYSGGQVFNLGSDKEIVKLAGLVKAKLDQNTRLLSGGELKAGVYSVTRLHNFKVDSGIKTLHVSVIVEKSNLADQIKLQSPSGVNIPATSIISKASIFEVVAPKIGSWKLIIPSSVGKYGYSVDAVSKDIIDFSYNFLYQANPRSRRIVPLENPFKGYVNILSIHIAPIDHVDTKTLKFDIVSKDGQTIKSNLPIKSTITKDVFHTKITSPNEPFKIRLTGKTNSGEDFERISREVAEPVAMQMRPIFAGDEFTAILSGGRVQAQMQFIDTGNADTFDISLSTNVGSVSPSSFTKSFTRHSFFTFYYYPPTNSSLHGRVATISFRTKKRSSGEAFKKSFEILLLKS